jgi:hypothetical protein
MRKTHSTSTAPPSTRAAPHHEIRLWALAKFLASQDGECLDCVYTGVLDRWPDLRFSEFVQGCKLAHAIASPPGGNA